MKAAEALLAVIEPRLSTPEEKKSLQAVRTRFSVADNILEAFVRHRFTPYYEATGSAEGPFVCTLSFGARARATGGAAGLHTGGALTCALRVARAAGTSFVSADPSRKAAKVAAAMKALVHLSTVGVM